MAAFAAKYGHCEVRLPIDYRAKSPFRPELAAPLDFALRLGEIYAHDRELDRAVLGVRDYSALLDEGAEWGLGGGELFASDSDPGAAGPPRAAIPERAPTRERLARRRQFILNELQFLADGARFRPPWTLPMLLDAQALLLRRLETPYRPGELREKPFVAVGARGEPVYRACPPERIAQELRALLEWVDRVGPTLAPVIPATVLLHGFYSIRPFPAGNIALGWVLAQYYLHLFGLPNVSLVPLSQVASEDPELRLRMMLWTESAGSYTELIDYSVDVLLAAYRSGAERWLDRQPEADVLEETALRLLSRARRTSGWFSAQEAASWVGGRSGQTVLRHLNQLVRRGIFESLGQTRAKRYRFVSRASLVARLARGVTERDTRRLAPRTLRARAGPADREIDLAAEGSDPS